MSEVSLQAALRKAGQLLGAANHAVVFTGAGISTPSGIPDFRSKRTGLWERYDPMKVASISVFQSQPEHFYGWLRPLLREIWQANPNPAHLALAKLEAVGLIKAVITQNIDDLHQRAGSKNVYEVHGSLRTLTCHHCNTCYPSETFRKALSTADEMARCPGCGQVVKPDITLFGEMLPTQTWADAEEHCRRADLMLVVGSSLEVWPAAALPEMCADNGAGLVINNLSPTHLDERANVLVPLNVAEALPEIARIALHA
jgi:NAD-dependent deacetylase